MMRSNVVTMVRFVVEPLEADAHGKADPHVRRLDVHQVRHDPHPLLELDERQMQARQLAAADARVLEAYARRA